MYATTAAYHADTTRVGHSMLDVFRRSRREYHARYVAKTLPEKPSTPALILGSLVHAVLLQPDKVADMFAVAPNVDRRTTDGKRIWAAFMEACAEGVTVVDQDMYDRAKAICEAVAAHPLSASILSEPGVNELPVLWDAPGGLRCKSRPDRWIPERRWIVDIKTTSEPGPEAFARACARYGYHRQAAWYIWGQDRLNQFGVAPPAFVFVVVQSEPPYEVAVYDLSAESLQLGHAENMKAVEELEACIELGDWLAVHERQITTISLPRWAGYSDYQ